MPTPLQKARKDPNSIKGKILQAARRIFGEYGFHGTTTRMIAEQVGIDVSTLYYHWGGKADLYEDVVADINKDLRIKLMEVEKAIHGLPLEQRIGIALDTMTDYLFKHPEIANIILSHYLAKIRHRESQELDVPMYISNIARSMDLDKDKDRISVRSKMQILQIMNSIYVFIAGSESFRTNLGIEKEQYISFVKDTLKFILIPPFSPVTGSNQSTGDEK